VEREIEVWYKSFDKATIESLFNPFFQVINILDMGFLYQLRRTMGLVLKGYFEAKTNDNLRKSQASVHESLQPH
jgi:hypothetical protein